MCILGSIHLCLNVDEIVRLIITELVTSRAEATAVALACCCKDFEDLALDVLWETQESLLLLVKSLPQDVLDGGRHTVSVLTTHVISSLNRPI